MADLKYYDIISKPVITEKSMAGYGMQRNTLSMYTQKQLSLRSKKLLRRCSKEQRLLKLTQ